MPKIRPYQPSPEQTFQTNKWNAVDELARKAGFDEDAFANTEFSRMPFFELIVDECIRRIENKIPGGPEEDWPILNNVIETLENYKKNIGNGA
jgi:hypothetical protein